MIKVALFVWDTREVDKAEACDYEPEFITTDMKLNPASVDCYFRDPEEGTTTVYLRGEKFLIADLFEDFDAAMERYEMYNGVLN